jgi:hypothetical protein
MRTRLAAATFVNPVILFTNGDGWVLMKQREYIAGFPGASKRDKLGSLWLVQECARFDNFVTSGSTL